MDTCNKISRYMESVGYPLPGDRCAQDRGQRSHGTDHCPGFGSAAKLIATTCMEICKDTNVYDNGVINVVEIMGRHAGWLAASASLASAYGFGPDLVYLPEVDFDMDRFLSDVDRVYRKKEKCW